MEHRIARVFDIREEDLVIQFLVGIISRGIGNNVFQKRLVIDPLALGNLGDPDKGLAIPLDGEVIHHQVAFLAQAGDQNAGGHILHGGQHAVLQGAIQHVHAPTAVQHDVVAAAGEQIVSHCYPIGFSGSGGQRPVGAGGKQAEILQLFIGGVVHHLHLGQGIAYAGDQIGKLRLIVSHAFQAAELESSVFILIELVGAVGVFHLEGADSFPLHLGIDHIAVIQTDHFSLHRFGGIGFHGNHAAFHQGNDNGEIQCNQRHEDTEEEK